MFCWQTLGYAFVPEDLGCSISLKPTCDCATSQWKFTLSRCVIAWQERFSRCRVGSRESERRTPTRRIVIMVVKTKNNVNAVQEFVAFRKKTSWTSGVIPIAFPFSESRFPFFEPRFSRSIPFCNLNYKKWKWARKMREMSFVTNWRMWLTRIEHAASAPARSRFGRLASASIQVRAQRASFLCISSVLHLQFEDARAKRQGR